MESPTFQEVTVRIDPANMLSCGVAHFGAVRLIALAPAADRSPGKLIRIEGLRAKVLRAGLERCSPSGHAVIEGRNVQWPNEPIRAQPHGRNEVESDFETVESRN